MTLEEERFVDCEVCGDRFVGKHAIRSYIREIELPNNEVKYTCTRCITDSAQAENVSFKGVLNNAPPIQWMDDPE